MRTSILTAATVSVALAGSFPTLGDEAADIRQLIPPATAISQRDYDKLVAGELKGLSDFQQQSLTAALLMMRPMWPGMLKETKEGSNREAIEAFQADRAELHVSAILREMSRQQDPKKPQVATSPITWVHADREPPIISPIFGNRTSIARTVLPSSFCFI